MTIEVFSAGRPAVPRRAALVTLAISVATMALAGWFSRARGSDPLGPRVAPEGWSLSFRPPRDFTPRSVLVSPLLGPAIRFTGPCGSEECELTYWHVPLSEAIEPEVLARLVARTLRPWRWSDLIGPRSFADASPALVGSARGVELLDESQGTTVRAAMLAPTLGVAVVLRQPAPPANNRLRTSFDASCRSVRQVEGAGSGRE